MHGWYCQSKCQQQTMETHLLWKLAPFGLEHELLLCTVYFACSFATLFCVCLFFAYQWMFNRYAFCKDRVEIKSISFGLIKVTKFLLQKTLKKDRWATTRSATQSILRPLGSPGTLHLHGFWAICYKSLTWIKTILGRIPLLNYLLWWPTGGKGRYKLPRQFACASTWLIPPSLTKDKAKQSFGTLDMVAILESRFSHLCLEIFLFGWSHGSVSITRSLYVYLPKILLDHIGIIPFKVILKKNLHIWQWWSCLLRFPWMCLAHGPRKTTRLAPFDSETWNFTSKKLSCFNTWSLGVSDRS